MAKFIGGTSIPLGSIVLEELGSKGIFLNIIVKQLRDINRCIVLGHFTDGNYLPKIILGGSPVVSDIDKRSVVEFFGPADIRSILDRKQKPESLIDTSFGIGPERTEVLRFADFSHAHWNNNLSAREYCGKRSISTDTIIFRKLQEIERILKPYK